MEHGVHLVHLACQRMRSHPNDAATATELQLRDLPPSATGRRSGGVTSRRHVTDDVTNPATTGHQVVPPRRLPRSLR